MWLLVSAIIFQLFKLIMLDKCVLTILELNWNQRLGHKRTKLNICHHMLTSSTQLQNRSFHVVERTTTSTKCQKMKNARAKCAKLLFFIVNYANLWGFCCRRRRGCLSSLVSSKRRRLETQNWKLNSYFKFPSLYTIRKAQLYRILKRFRVKRMAFRAWKVFGTFEKRAPV